MEGREGKQSLTTLLDSDGLDQALDTKPASAYFCTTCRLRIVSTFFLKMVGGNGGKNPIL